MVGENAPAVLAAIAARRSIRTYRPEAVPSALIERLLQAAVMAPSAHHRQPWRFVLLRELEAKTALAEAMGRRLAEDRSRDGDLAEAIRRDVERSTARITGAPQLVLVCLTLEAMDAYPDRRRAEAEFLMAVQSTAMAAQNLLLAAAVEGLAACWMCGPLFCPDTVRSVLALPDAWQPQGLITLGWPAAAGKLRPRKPLDAVIIERDSRFVPAARPRQNAKA